MLTSSFLGILFAFMAGVPESWIIQEPFHKWSLDRAVRMLNTSPWARQETFTRVISGVGSGISGEKEIYNTFYVRFLSARPIREAYARVQQIQHGYDRMSPEEKRSFEEAQLSTLDLDVSRWIVVSVSFRSNDPNEESTVRRFFQSETAETLKTKAYLSTPSCPQVGLSAYFPQREESVGAKFVFRRELDGVPVLTKDCPSVTLELLNITAAITRLRATFEVEPMIVGGQLVF
jgi:hypothetical protein